MREFTVSKLMVIVALVVFVLATFHVPAPIDLVAAGLAAYMLSILIPAA